VSFPADWQDAVEERGVDARLVKLLRECLSHNPQKRPADAGVILRRLDDVLGAAAPEPAAVAPTERVRRAARPRTGTLTVERKKDEAADEGIRIDTRKEGGEWRSHGVLVQGESLTVELEEGTYQVRARVGSGEDQDEEKETVTIEAGATAKVRVYAFCSTTGDFFGFGGTTRLLVLFD
jgi:hypothetical protein